MLDKRREDRIRQDSKDWKYSHRDRSTAGGWVKLLNRFEIKCNDANIGHVLDPARLAEIRTLPDPAPQILYQQQYDEEGNAIPESAAEKSERVLQNKRAYDDYKAIKTIKMQEQAKLPANFDTAITTLYSLLDNVIVEALDVKKAEVRRQGVTSSEQLYAILREELENQHRPHTSLDAVKLRQNLKDLRGDYIGWRAYLQ